MPPVPCAIRICFSGRSIAGFKSRLRTYSGPNVPIPLVIGLQHGDADLETVAHDNFAVTKHNFDTCKLVDKRHPLNVKLTDAVAEILIANQGTQGSCSQMNVSLIG